MDNGRVIEVDPERFEEMVAAALDGLPEELGRLVSNAAVDLLRGHQPPRVPAAQNRRICPAEPQRSFDQAGSAELAGGGCG
jgi:hypothetical protein